VGTNSSNEGVVVTIGPVQVTCGKVHYSGGAVALANCNHNGITGGAGTFTQTPLPNPVTETVTWENGATSVATENIDVLEGPTDKWAPRAGFQGHENKVTGTITGGTATALIGGTLARKTCLYEENDNSAVEIIKLLPGTVAQY
jgi:hypothetical protein